MKYRKPIILLLLFLQLGCSVTRLQKQGNVEPGYFYSKIEFVTYKSVICLDVNIDGEVKRFLFDTGADLSVLQRDSIVGKTSQYSGASKRKMELGTEIVASMKIGNVNFADTYALSGNMVGLKEQVPGFGGLIGQSIIQKANWLIDYPGRQMEISNRNLAGASFGEIKTIRRKGNSPYTFLEMNGHRYKVVIDLGSSSTINLPEDSKFAKDVAQTIELTENSRERYTLGGLQTIREKKGTIPKVRLGAFEFENVEVNINTSSQPRIGMKFFGDYLIYIDHSNGGVYKLKKSGVKNGE